MAGTREGGLAAAETNKRRHGEDHYVRAGQIGGRAGLRDGAIKGFAYMKATGQTEKLRRAGMLGGSISRRTKKV